MVETILLLVHFQNSSDKHPSNASNRNSLGETGDISIWHGYSLLFGCMLIYFVSFCGMKYKLRIQRSEFE